MRRAFVPIALFALTGWPLSAQPADDAARALQATRRAEQAADAESRRLAAAATAADARVVRSERAVADLSAALAHGDRDLADAQARLAAAERARRDSSAALVAARAPLAALVATLVRQQRQPPALLLAMTPDLTTNAHLRAALAAVAPEIEARAEALRRAVTRAADERRAAADAVTVVAARREVRDRQRAALMLAVAEAARQRDLAAADASVARQQAEGLAEQQTTLEQLVTSLTRSNALGARLAALPGPDPRPGSIVTPPPRERAYRLPAAGRLLAGMGETSATGLRTRGLLLATAPGATVRAPAGGTIAYSGPFRAWRAIVIVDHGHGWTTLLAGLATAARASGARVVQGEPIGRAGNRLLIELRHNGRPIDVAAMAEASS